jgi:hypothetical protein
MHTYFRYAIMVLLLVISVSAVVLHIGWQDYRDKWIAEQQANQSCATNNSVNSATKPLNIPNLSLFT